MTGNFFGFPALDSGGSGGRKITKKAGVVRQAIALYKQNKKIKRKKYKLFYYSLFTSHVQFSKPHRRHRQHLS